MTSSDSAGRLAVVVRYFLALCGAGLWLGATLHADGSSRYRTHELGSRVAQILEATGARATDVVIRHERPSRIQRLEWRPPYTRRETVDADPVESLSFDFVDDRLYQITVDYDRTRIASLTTADIVSGIDAVYGPQRPDRIDRVATRDFGPEGTTVLAQWGDDQATVTLVRGPYEDLHLVVRSAELGTLATRAIAAAKAQDVTDGPAREAAEKASAATARAAERTKNRAAFKP